jgi:hypothetical protein
VRYETTYVIVAGVAWIRRSRVETASGVVEDTAWAVLFDGEVPSVHRSAVPGELTVRRGQIGELDWELDWTELAPPFETPGPALRRLAPTHLVTHPALAVSGRVGERVLDGAPGHTSRLWGRRHARSWGWAHASTAHGRWVHVLTASAPPLPRVSQHGHEGRPPRFPLARGSVDGTAVRVGPYVVDAPVESFIGLRYLDTDDSHVWCYHSERGRLRGAGLQLDGAALEIATRTPIEGWRVEE